jgi:hypothetical protein
MHRMIPDLDRVTSQSYLANLTTRPMADIRRMRAECQTIENGVSYVRRLTQGRIDIVAAELQRRRDGGNPTDVSELIRQLPDILADHQRSGGTIRAPQDLSVEHIADELVDQLDQIVGSQSLRELGSHPDDDLVRGRDALTEFERMLSSARRAIHDTLDALQAEITRRYQSGEATVDSLLQ